MKRKILPIVISSVAALTAQAAFAEVDLYGKIDLTLQTQEEEAGGADDLDTIKLNSNASRLGFKGSEDINDSLKAIYKLEYEVYPDSGDNGPFKTRNAYIGLQANAGTFLAGQHDTPMKMSKGKADLFDNYKYADIGDSTSGVMSGEIRADNLIAYISPDMNGFGVSVALQSGEGDGVSDNTTDDRNSIGDGISAAGTYKMDGLYLAVAMDQDVGNTDRIRLTGGYAMDAFAVNLIYQTGETTETTLFPGGDVDETSYVLSGSYTIDSWKLKAQYGAGTYEYNNVAASDNEEDRTQLTFGADYKLSKTTKVFGYYAMAEQDVYTSDDDSEQTSLAVGMQHNF